MTLVLGTSIPMCVLVWPGQQVMRYICTFLVYFVQFLVLEEAVSRWWGTWNVFKKRKIKVKHEKVVKKIAARQ